MTVVKPHAFKKWAHLCDDRWPDDDDGPPWGPRPVVTNGRVLARYQEARR